MGLTPGSGRSPGEGHGHPLQSSSFGESHGQKSLVGYSPWGCKEVDTTEVTQHAVMINPHLLKVFIHVFSIVYVIFPLVLYLYFMLFLSPFGTYLCISTNILTFTFLYLFLHILLEFLFSQHSKFVHSPMYVTLISTSSSHIFSCQYFQLHIQTHTYLPLGKNFLILILLFLLLKLSLLIL